MGVRGEADEPLMSGPRRNSVTSSVARSSRRMPARRGSLSSASILSPTTPGNPEDDDDVDEDLDFGVDIYSAVVVAAFGGITQRLSMREKLNVHPAVLFLGCVLVVKLQLSAIVYLRLDMDLEVPVWSNSTYRHPGYEGEINHLGERVAYEDRPSRAKILVALKILMVFVVQMVQFDRLARSLRMLIFLMNPVTWMDMARPQLDKDIRFWWCYSQYVLQPLSIVAKLLQLVVDYVICVDAVSIILASNDCKDVIYDSLAITFIADLGASCWAVTKTVIHIDEFQDFKFQIAKTEDKLRREGDSRLPPWLTNLKCLSHVASKGGYARKVEIFATFLIAAYILYRQALVILFALETDILPMARDVCTLFRWGEHEAHNLFMISWVWRLMEAYLLVKNPTEAIRHIADKDQGGYCEEKYDRMHLSDERKVLWDNPWLLLIFVFLLLPQIFVCYNNELRKMICYKDAIESFVDHEAQKEAEVDDSERKKLTEEVKSLKHQVTQLQLAKYDINNGNGEQKAEDSQEVQELKSRVQELRTRQEESNNAIRELRAKLESMNEAMERSKPKKRGWSRSPG